jgi:hypothetical protein
MHRHSQLIFAGCRIIEWYSEACRVAETGVCCQPRFRKLECQGVNPPFPARDT